MLPEKEPLFRLLQKSSPWEILEVKKESSLQEIQEAFEIKSSQAQGKDLEQLKEAYFTLMDPLERERSELLYPGKGKDLSEMKKTIPKDRKYLGPEAWYKLIGSKRKS